MEMGDGVANAPHRTASTDRPTTSDASAICWDDISARRRQRRASSTSFAADEAIGLAQEKRKPPEGPVRDTPRR